MGNKIEEKSLDPFPGPPECLPLPHHPPDHDPRSSQGSAVPADGLSDGGLALQHRPPRLMVGRGHAGCLSGHTHASQESLPSQGLGNGVTVRGLDGVYPQPLLAGAYLQEAGLL